MKKKVKMSRGQKATVYTKVEDLSDKERLDHYNAVVIEELKSRMRSVAEAVENFHTILSRKIDDFCEETRLKKMQFYNSFSFSKS